MPMTRRQLHQTEIDYQDFLPTHAHVTDVREMHKCYDTKKCAICGERGNRKKSIGYVRPLQSLTGRWAWTALQVCRNGRGCRGRAYDAKLK